MSDDLFPDSPFASPEPTAGSGSGWQPDPDSRSGPGQRPAFAPPSEPEMNPGNQGRHRRPDAPVGTEPPERSGVTGGAEAGPAGPDRRVGTEPLLVATGVTRVFPSPGGDVVANDHIDLSVRPGELVVVAGPSGAGKTTLLNLLAGLDRPTSGEVALTGRPFAECSDKQLAQLRREYIGYVFQSFGLLPMLSARENVEVPLRLLRMSPAERDARVVEVLGDVGLSAHLDQRPYELSGGQQQRVSLARALVARPQLLLADEPTGQLDSATAGTIIDLIRDLVHRTGVAAVVVTHDELLMDMADRLILLRDGRASTAAAGAAIDAGPRPAGPADQEVSRGARA